jgi:hypothetical protein
MYPVSYLQYFASIEGDLRGQVYGSRGFRRQGENEGYIRGMSIRNAFVSLVSLMEKFQGQPFLAPGLGGDGTGYERICFVNNEDAVA